MDLAIESPPLLRELHLGVDVLNGNGEVDKVQVKVVQTPELEGVLAALLDLILRE